MHTAHGRKLLGVACLLAAHLLLLRINQSLVHALQHRQQSSGVSISRDELPAK
jgi:hypothetical protein